MDFFTKLFEDPVKAKKAYFISVGLLGAVLVGITIALGYLFYRSYSEVQDLSDDKTALTRENKNLKDEVDELEDSLLEEGECLDQVDDL